MKLCVIFRKYVLCAHISNPSANLLQQFGVVVAAVTLRHPGPFSRLECKCVRVCVCVQVDQVDMSQSPPQPAVGGEPVSLTVTD